MPRERYEGFWFRRGVVVGALAFFFGFAVAWCVAFTVAGEMLAALAANAARTSRRIAVVKRPARVKLCRDLAKRIEWLRGGGNVQRTR
jgi:hypothetical protein